MKFPFFISTRYILSNRDSRLLNLVSVITIVGIALGCATLIVALSVLSGFEKTLTNKISDFDSHIKITSFTDYLPDINSKLKDVNNTVGKYLEFSSPYIENLVIIGKKKRKDGISLKGISDENAISRISQNIIAGSIDFTEKNKIVVGKTLAIKLFLNVGDKVTLFALKQNKVPSIENPPNIENFQVVGIFESGMAEYDDLIGYTDVQSAQNLFSMQGKLNGIDIKTSDLTKVDSLTKVIRDNSRYPYRVRSMFETHRNIFTWIDLQKKPIPIVLGLIILVAVFNIISALLMIVLEKTNAIGTLKSLGAKRNQIVKIFLIQGSYLSLIGIITGNLLAYALMLAQDSYNIIKVPSSVYFVTQVPFDFSLDIFLIVSVIAFLLSIISATVPSLIASRINPVTALRFE